jgi:hypothetical protein
MWSKRLATAAVVWAAFGTGLAAQAGVEKAQMEFEVASTKGDKAAYQRALTDDFTWVNQAGRLRDKKTVVSELQPDTSGGRSEGFDVRAYPGGAVVIGTRKTPGTNDARFIRLWVQQGNQWRLAAHQGTRISDKPVAAAGTASSPIPPNSGAASEITAIDQAIAALQTGNSQGDARNFGASVTDGFVGIQVGGNAASKQERMVQIAKGPNPPAQVNVEEISTRIHGDLAVTNRVVKDANGRSRQMIIHAKQGGRWLRAAIIMTPIATGNAVGQ